MIPNRVGRGLLVRIFLLIGAASLLLWACKLNQEEQGRDTLSFTALFDSLKAYDSVVIVLKRADGNGEDTLFKGKVKARANIQNLPAPGFDGKIANLVISGFNAGKLELAVEKKYDGSAQETENTKQIVVPGTTLSFDPTPIRLGENDSADLPTVTVNPASVFDKSLQWSTSNAAVFVVDGKRVVAKGKGTAVLSGSLKSDPAKSLSITVTVFAYQVPVASIEFRSGPLRLYVGGAPESLFVSVLPAEANPGVDFILTDSGKARIESSRILGVATGALTVIARSKADASKRDTLEVTVLPSANTGAPIPAAPTIASLNAGDGAISTVWSPVSGADSYNLYYADGASVDKNGSRMKNVVSPFSITGLKNGKTYAIALTAVNPTGESELGAVKTTTPRASAPGAPLLAGAAPGDKKATVSWNAVSGAESYVLYYAAGTTVDKSANKISNAVPPMEVGSLANGTLYAFAVSAVSAGAESELSNILTATPQVAAPSAPIIGSVSGGDGKATVSWGAVSGAVSYRLYYMAGATVDKAGTAVPLAVSPHVVAGLTNGTQYSFAVSAVSPGGESALSPVVSVSPQAAAPGAPVIASVVAGDKSAGITWGAVPDAASYVLYYKAGNSVDKSGTKVAGAVSPSMVSGLLNGTQYAFAVAAVTSGGESGLSNIVTATPVAAIPGIPAIESVSVGDGNASVAWGAVAGAVSYNLYYAVGIAVDKTGTKVSGVTSPRNVPGLANGTQYAFAISAVSPGGESALSPAVTGTPMQAVPGAPAISAVVPGDKKATVTWAAVAGATSYAVYYKTGTTVDKTGSKIPVTAPPFEVPGLTNGTGYAFAVTAITEGGESALSNIVTATPQVAAPPVPSISSVTAGSGKATVAWGASAGAASYNIYYAAGTTVDKTAPRLASDASPAEVTGLTNGTQYAFAVSAVNPGGESALSPVVPSTPQAPAPGAPVLGSVAIGDAKATATWAAVTGAVSYNLYYTAGSTVSKTGTKLTGVTSPREITALSNCLQYAFAVSAVSAGGESGLSNVITATPKAAAPVITAHPLAQSKCVSQAASFSVTATGSGTLSYEWRKGGGAIAGAATATYAISSVSAGSAGDYTCAVSSGCSDVVVSNPAALTVQTPPVIGTNLTNPAVQHPGNSLTLSIAATGTATLNYQWKKGGTDISGAPNANSLTLSNLAVGDHNSVYTCLVTNPCGTGTLSASATLQVVANSRISVGSGHYLILTADATLWGGGFTSHGELGFPSEIQQKTALQVMSGVSEFEAGTERSFYLKTDGSLWASGRNTFGRLGDGTTTNRSAPVRVMASSGVAFGNVSKIASGQDHTLFLKTDGTVWACGRNETGQLGDGSGQDQPYPVQVKTSAGVNLTGATAISAGGFHSMVLTSGGTVYAFGGGYYGQLGLGNEGDLPYATQVQTGVEKISANYQNSYCLKTGGALFVTGRNFYGELGDGTTAKKTAYFQAQTGISDITTGESHLLLKKTNGSIWACGYNIYGQLGDGGTSDISTPVQVLAGSVASFDGGGSQSLFFLSDGTLSGAGYILTPTIQRLSY